MWRSNTGLEATLLSAVGTLAVIGGIVYGDAGRWKCAQAKAVKLVEQQAYTANRCMVMVIDDDGRIYSELSNEYKAPESFDCY